MKKIKIVLITASVLSVVGGTLAFKASKYCVSYCAGVVYVDGTATSDCTTEVTSTTFNPTIILYAKVKPVGDCSGQTCPSIALGPE